QPAHTPAAIPTLAENEATRSESAQRTAKTMHAAIPASAATVVAVPSTDAERAALQETAATKRKAMAAWTAQIGPASSSRSAPLDICSACGKRVYLMEKITLAEKILIHRRYESDACANVCTASRHGNAHAVGPIFANADTRCCLL